MPDSAIASPVGLFFAQRTQSLARFTESIEVTDRVWDFASAVSGMMLTNCNLVVQSNAATIDKKSRLT
jgi:hypothetical protein